MPSPAQDTTESQRNDQTFAPGLMVKVRDELWLITNVTQSVDGYLLKVRGLSDYGNHRLRQCHVSFQLLASSD